MNFTCNQSLEYNENSYQLFTAKAGFNQAKQNCSDNGGSLASELDCDAYKVINNCLSVDSACHFFIELVRETNNLCKNVSLQVMSSKEDPQCVTIIKRDIFPNAKAVNCNETNCYICQTKIPPSVTLTNPTKKSTTSKPMLLTSNKIIPSTSSTVNDDAAAAAFNTLLIPVVIGVVVLTIMLLLIVLCFFLNKQRCLKRFQNSKELQTSINSNLKETRNNPIYDG